jgi:acetyl-CoA synthetase
MFPKAVKTAVEGDKLAKDDLYRELYTNFRWHVPQYFNIGWECCGRWAEDRARFALYHEDEGDDQSGGRVGKFTYWDLQQEANRLSNALTAMGVRRGDRVAIVLPQRPETIVAHIAIYQMGAVAMPLSILFGPDALEYRLHNSAAAAIIIDGNYLDNLSPVRDNCPLLKHVLVVGDKSAPDTHDYAALLARHSRDFVPVKTLAEDPALLIYTSGTTGPPKGALKPHRVLIGNLPGFVASQNWFPKPADVFWSPADWAWTGGLMDALLPTLYFGQPIVAGMAKSVANKRERFDPLKAYALMERYGVTNAFIFPTALKMMMKAIDKPRGKYDLKLRAIMSAGESVGETVFSWAQRELGVTINEMCGQTEINYVVGNSCEKWPAKPGSIGRPYPGHRVAVIDAEGREVKAGTAGEMAVNRYDMHGDPDPVFFLGYWRNDAATRNKYSGDWCRTGDEAIMDEDGYLWYQGRADDMFKSAGYRIGPSEVENCLVKHTAVANCAVVPKPDEDRGAIVKAYVVLIEGMQPSSDLISSLQEFVRGKLAPYEYPKEIEFVEGLPMTTTGKVQRRVLRLAEEERHRQKLAAAAQ